MAQQNYTIFVCESRSANFLQISFLFILFLQKRLIQSLSCSFISENNKLINISIWMHCNALSTDLMDGFVLLI